MRPGWRKVASVKLHIYEILKVKGDSKLNIILTSLIDSFDGRRSQCRMI